MKIEKYTKESFSVIGREGTTEDGPDFVRRLWADANSHFSEVASLAKTDQSGAPAGFWGAMSDFSRSFLPWEDNFSRGLYLAGVECPDDAQAPDGWQKWQIPGFLYLRAEYDRETLFPEMMAYLQSSGLQLAGAVQDFTCPTTGKNYMCFPIQRL